MPEADAASTKAQRLAVLGAGKMATALVQGIVEAGLIPQASVVASDPNPAAIGAFVQATGAAQAATNAEAAAKADVVLIAVKPQHLPAVLAEIADALPAGALVVSVAAGVTLTQLSAGLPIRTRAIRVMPNTPCLIGRGASVFARGPGATDADAELVAALLGSVGYASEAPESQLDAVTGLSGSGPAYVYAVIQALGDAGVREGLPRALASELAARTVAGAAEMVLQTGEHPSLLAEAVTSPGGTTAAGLAALSEHNLQHALAEAVHAATNRSRELGQNR
ncbi:MAG: pyrroline-5-carboxylate reductase [Planctomycetota bacterium]